MRRYDSKPIGEDGHGWYRIGAECLKARYWFVRVLNQVLEANQCEVAWFLEPGERGMRWVGGQLQTEMERKAAEKEKVEARSAGEAIRRNNAL